MAERFNKMSFEEKILTLQANKEILSLGSDGNWWVVKVNDEEINEQLYDSETGFYIENEWGSDEMHTFVDILGINLTDI